MAPPLPILLFPRGDLSVPMPPLPHGTGRLVAGPRQGACQTPKRKAGPEKHDGGGVARTTLAPLGEVERSPAGAPRLTTMDSCGASRSPRSCLLPHETDSHKARTRHTQPSLYLYPCLDVPAFYLLVIAPSVQKKTTRHNTTPAECSPTLPIGYAPGAKPRTTWPGRHPMGGVLTVAGGPTLQCQTPAQRTLRPPSTGRLGITNG